MSHVFEVVPEWVHVTHVESGEFREVYGFAGGGQGTVNLEGIRLRPKDRQSRTLVVYMHPASTLQLLPLPRAMVERGVHVLCAGSRYARNDSPLVMEKVLLDLGCVPASREGRLGVRADCHRRMVWRRIALALLSVAGGEADHHAHTCRGSGRPPGRAADSRRRHAPPGGARVACRHAAGVDRSVRAQRGQPGRSRSGARPLRSPQSEPAAILARVPGALPVRATRPRSPPDCVGQGDAGPAAPARRQ